ncbi:hypothetical protein M3J09_008682 [Ascochyta lentis]
MRPLTLRLPPPRLRLPTPPTRPFTLIPSPSTRSNKNRIFDNIRHPQDLHTLTLLNAADNRALITFCSATWCATCRDVRSVLRELVEEERVGEREGGVGVVEVEIDSTLIGDLPVTYRISSLPTLLAFSRQEAQFETVLTRPGEMRDRAFLREWVLSEARRGGRKGGGGGAGLFGW